MKRVLIVDDEPSIREMLSGFLGDEDYDVTTASNGQQALEIAVDQMPDIVLLDVMMPGLDGREVSRRLRQAPETSHLPIVLMSAASRIDPGEFGADIFLSKPFDLFRLLEVIETLTDRHDE
jgi:two-component system, cell cycle response regulator